MVTRTAGLGDGTSTTTPTENFIYNGQNIALVLDGSGNVIERNLTGQAADQVFATEEVVSGRRQLAPDRQPGHGAGRGAVD